MNEPQQEPGQKPASAPKWLWITLIIVVLIGGAFAAWYFLMGPGKAVESSTATTTTTTPATTAVDETADWKTYTNTTDNYSMKYPKTWEYKINNSIVEFRETGKTYAVEGTDIAAITVSVANNTDSKTLTQIANTQNETGSPVSLKLDDIDASKITNKNVTRVLCVANNKIYSISANNVGEDAINTTILTIFNQMIPTFKFTTAAASATTSTADWKTYTDSTYGFSIKYPKRLATDTADWIYKVFVAGSLEDIGFGTPASTSGGYTWGITIKKLADGCQAQGTQFADKKSSDQNVTVAGKTAVLTTVTTASQPDWYSQVVCVKNDKYTYAISNGAVKNESFKSFYESFQFTK